MVEAFYRQPLSKVHTNLSTILKIINCDRRIYTLELGNACRDTYLLLLDSFPWANVTPTLHKVLSHSGELLEINPSYGYKCFSEEISEACSKLIHIFREHLSRKTSFEDNIVDIFVRLASESDLVLQGVSTAYLDNYIMARAINFIHFESIALVDYVNAIRSVKICMMSKQ